MITSSRSEKLEAFGKLLDVMDTLRAECPWDRKQTFESLSILSIEEMYELTDAIASGDRTAIEEEVGDVLLHMIFYALLGQEEQAFDIKTILDRERQKLIRRHPHIYGDTRVRDEEEVKRNWEKIKLREKGAKKKSVLGGVPRGLPALVKAYRLQEKTAQFGFEWETVREVYEKVEEELGELQEAVIGGEEKERQTEEFGDVLFSLVNYARFLNIDPEAALERCNQKFKSRFEYIETHADKSLDELSLQDMDKLWNEAKGQKHS